MVFVHRWICSLNQLVGQIKCGLYPRADSPYRWSLPRVWLYQFHGVVVVVVVQHFLCQIDKIHSLPYGYQWLWLVIFSKSSKQTNIYRIYVYTIWILNLMEKKMLFLAINVLAALFSRTYDNYNDTLSFKPILSIAETVWFSTFNSTSYN